MKRIALALVSILACHGANAAHCEGGSHMTCSEGIDESGRSPGALYDAAVEGLREASTAAQRALARKAMKDAFDPAMANQRAVLCNRTAGGPEGFQQCVHGPGPAVGLKITIPCQQNLTDGRVLMDGQFLAAGARYEVLHYYPQSARGDGWTRGVCDVTVIKTGG